MILESLTSVLVSKIGDALLQLRREAVESTPAHISIDDSGVRSALVDHVQLISRWASTITLQSLAKEKQLAKTFVDLTMRLGVQRFAGASARKSVIRLNDLYAQQGHAAILGGPGAGKTTSLQRIAQLALVRWQDGSGGVPILVRLRDLQNDATPTEHILSLLGVAVDYRSGEKRRDDRENRRLWEMRTITQYLAAISACLLLDGLDEVDPAIRSSVELLVRDLALASDSYRLFITCRSADYHVAFQQVQVHTILPMSASQVKRFATRWLGRTRATAFLQALSARPYAGTEVVPLTCAHLCAIYERDGDIPPRPIDVYEIIVSLLIEQWDRQRGVTRVSRYAEFTTRKKERFLQAIAFELAIAGHRGSFRRRDLVLVYQYLAVQFNLPADECDLVLAELESHTGIIQSVGHDQYDWVHIAIQEYLAAMHAHRTANVSKRLVPSFPNEMALVVAYSTSPDDFLESVAQEVLQVDSLDARERFTSSFLARLAREAATFSSTTRVGWILVSLLDALVRPSMRTKSVEDQVHSADIGRLLSSPDIAAAIAAVVEDANVERRDNTFLLSPAAADHLPAHFGDDVLPQQIRRSVIPPWLRLQEGRASAVLQLPMTGLSAELLLALRVAADQPRPITRHD